jgi:hypothetical protein
MPQCSKTVRIRLRCRQQPALIASARDEGNLALPEPVKRAILASKSPGIRRMSD